jgi:hypothetical protein
MIDYQKLLDNAEAEKAELQKAFSEHPDKFSYRTQKFYTDAIRGCIIHICHYERKLKLTQKS